MRFRGSADPHDGVEPTRGDTLPGLSRVLQLGEPVADGCGRAARMLPAAGDQLASRPRKRFSGFVRGRNGSTGRRRAPIRLKWRRIPW